jgi:dihydroorotate dehydrogenase (fumarate)
MEKLKTHYLGLELKSPVIVSSSRLTSSLKNLAEAEESGAGAVVLKSLFEEQILYNAGELSSSSGYPEADDYISWYTRFNTVDSYLNLLKEAKRHLSIPVIPSINCYSIKGWIDFSKKLQDAGADALEVNAFFLPVDRRMTSDEAEKMYFDLIEDLTGKISIPIVIKIGFRFSNILYMIGQFHARGVKGVVMFNRFYEPDIDIHNMEIVPAQIFSNGNERRYVLRWIAMASAQGLRINIAASTGVTGGEDVIRYILAGADAVQVCSVLYEKGISYISEINRQIAAWMDDKKFNSIDDFRGKLNWKNSGKPVVFERSQFMKYFSSVD